MNRLRLRWITWLSLSGVLLAGVAAYFCITSFFAGPIHPEPWQFLARVEQLERAGADPASVQMLGECLAVLGRDDEVRQLDFYPQGEMPHSTVAAEDLKLT